MRIVSVFAMLALIGCANPTGQSCDSSACPDGFACVRLASGLPQRQCMPACERRSDCMGEETCAQGLGATPSCDRYGTRSLGADCADIAAAGGATVDACGPGLRCPAAYIPWTCRPACEASSPHSEDRTCPAGMVCELTGLDVCLDLCDPDDRSACNRADGVVCVRYTHEELGAIGACMRSGPWNVCGSGASCAAGLVCAGETCQDPVDAPALPWPVGDSVPPLVD